ncbi:glycogen operon protein [Pelagirhabdus alkalitolerans]|uniref:Glycogen operon protein n=1 Tax=Pelagirhabdus alkalitolerans TaxID=1612202 RepID=A0A1G6KAD5_9BACI|nr:glycogen debranching protein GlgX [Pelagirhabdus alkalitolerans]SDC28032.1 glycogen operon protein [Pelagirhabdus alkalitolerans]
MSKKFSRNYPKYQLFSKEYIKNLTPQDHSNGFDIRPGFFDEYGTTVLPNGVNFTVHSQHATSFELVLFKRAAEQPYAKIPFPKSYRVGNVYSMIVFDLDIEEFEYAYVVDGPYAPEAGLVFDHTNYLLDPYAKAVSGQSEWGVKPSYGMTYRARVVSSNMDWEENQSPDIPMEDLIIYEMHVRGFTKHPSSNVENPGTYHAIEEKIPYLKELGVNAIELMPIFEFDEMSGMRVHNGRRLYDYWGYNPVSFFAPNTGYTSNSEYNREGTELKKVIKKLHDHGIEVILDVVFNHTAEGNEQGPHINLKGFDNSVYYMLTPDGQYFNFSGCGNTLNCNHPIVRRMILDCLRHWVIEYRVDGFRFDLASILGRNEDGTPMNNPPLLQNLAYDPVLAKVKLIAEAWDAGGLYQVGSFPDWNRFSEWNGKYRDDLRAFLKGDAGFAHTACDRIAGSIDLYPPDLRHTNPSVNFITCHDGFTLNDLYSYNDKHNWDNGWDNTDGENHNLSWNCGHEGPTDDQHVIKLRNRMMKNAMTVLMASRGTPMILSGDEFCNTQFGNNNAYCQDNDISWLNWSLLEENQDMFTFYKKMIRLRKKHPILRRRTKQAKCGVPHFSKHGIKPWYLSDWEEERVIGVMLAGRNLEDTEDDLAYIAINAHWESHTVELPMLPNHLKWHLAVNTDKGEGEECFCDISDMPVVEHTIELAYRSVIILFASTAW